MKTLYLLLISSFLVGIASPKLHAQTGPGGITPAAWYKADAQNTVFSDAGITNATDNDNVQQWNEYLGAVHNLTQTTSGSRPVFSNATTLVNFNPTVTFNLDYLEYQPATGVDIIDRTQGTLYTAGYFNVVGPAGIMGFDASMDYPGLHTSNNGQNNLLFYTGGPGYQGVSTSSFTDNNYFISGANWTNGAGSTSAYASSIVSLDGVRSSYNTNQLQNAVINNLSRDIRVGRDNNWGGMNGQVNEVIIFENALSMAEMDRVESYLAIKYGNTYAQGGSDYVNAAGATVWTADATYSNNIFGIARDDASELYQKQSKSTNQNQQLVIGAGSGLFNTNAANSNTLTNGQFLMVGDNGLAQSLTTPLTYTDPGGGNGDTNFRFESVWKVQNTNGVGTVTIAWPAGIDNLYVVQSTDETFDATDDFEPMTGTVNINGVDYNTATLTLTDGQYFTLAGYTTAPGGVVGVDFWVKSDDAGAIATAWKDHSANADDIPAVGTWALSPADRNHNFHPYTTDYSSSKLFYNNNNSALNPNYTSAAASPPTNHSIFTAVRPTSSSDAGRIVGLDDDTNAAEPGMATTNAGLPNYYEFYNRTTDVDFSTPFITNVPNIFSATANNPAGFGDGTSVSPGGETRLGLNGTYEVTPITDAANRFQLIGQRLRIGYAGWTNGGVFPGDIMEVVWYNRLLTPNEQSRVNSYLAIKNGTTLAENYLASNSNVVWGITSNTGYNNHIFGLARDNVSGLHQKQATSTDVNQKLVIGNGSSLFDTNAANTNDLTDGQFLLVGDNGLAQSLTTPLAYTGGANGDTNFRFESIWKVQNTNSVGQVTIAWPVGINNLYLVQSTDETFDGSDTFTAMTTVVTINGEDYNTATVSLIDGQFFTFAGYMLAPGGVAGQDFWVRSDMVGDIATAWQDHSLNADDMPNVGGMTLSAADRAHNFHPYTTDYSSSKYFYNDNSAINPLGNVELPNTNTSIFSAVRPVTAGTGRIIGIDDDATLASEPAMSIENGFPRQYEFFAGTTGTNFSTTFNIGVPNVFSAIANNSVANGGTSTSSGGEKVLGLNGVYETTPYTGSNRFQIYGINLRVGHAGWDAPGAFPGDIMEVVWYNRLLTSNEQSRVNSYLAIKNGTTLAENYLAANSNVVWDITANTGYNNNIFGVARDNVSALHQKQATSTAVGQQLVIGNGSSLFDTNAYNTNDLTDGQFLIVGDNGLAQSLATPLVYTAGSNGETNFRFESIWKVQNTNAIGNVTVAWPVGISNLYVVQSGDETFDSSDNFTAMDNTVTINGVDYNTATVTLGDGEFFTFAGYATGPGGVMGTDFWVKTDDAGDISTAWKDLSQNADDIPAIGTWALSPADATHNFHPYTTDYSTTKNFHNNNTLLNPGGGDNITSHSIFSSVRPTSTGTGRITGIGTGSGSYGSNPSIASNGGAPNYYDYEATTTNLDFSTDFENQISNVFSAVADNSIANGGGSTFSGGEVTLGLNGVYETTTFNNSNEFQFNGPNLRVGYSTFGTGAGNFPGDIMEVIWYKRALTSNEQSRVNTYLAIRNGVTLGEDYLSAASEVVWDRTNNLSYHNNVFGIARDDAGILNQKVSNSVNSITEGKLTVATTDDFVASNADASRTSFTNDEAYILFGDNEATGETSLATDPCTGETLNPAVSTTNRVWRVENTNTIDAVWLQADLSAYTFNSDIEMWVADDEAFTTNLVKVSAASYTSGIATFNTLFPEGVKYIKFAGIVTPSQCDVCTGGTFVFKTGRSWNTLAERTNNVIDSETTGTTDQGDLIVDMDVADPANVEYGPNSTPRPYGRWMISRRYDNQNVALTHTINLNQAVAGASFQISNINTYLNNANRFTVEGYDCDGNLVLPKITEAIENSTATTYEIQGNEVVGTKPYRGLASLYSTANVRFDRVIQSIVIIQEVDRTNTRNTLRSLNIGDISFECAVALPPTEDNVTMIQDFTQNEDVPTCLETTMRMRLVNNNCDTRTVNISQTLPAGLEFVADTYNDSEFTTAPAYTYNANTFTLNGLQLPSGTNYLYINVRSTAGTTTTYNTSSSFTVQETGNSYNSIDPASNADSQVSFEASGYAAPALDVTYTVNATCLEEGTPVTYTLNFDNQEGSAITGATLQAYYALGQEISSVTLNNGITGTQDIGAAGDSYIEYSNLTIPTGISSIDVQIDITSDIFTDEPTASSVFQLITEPGNACAEENPIVSNVIELSECAPADYCVSGCNPNTFLNTGDPNTIEYDNMVSTFHSTMMRQPDGKLMVWGERMANDGTSHLLAPTEVNSTNYPALTGDILKFTGGSSSINRVQSVVLTTDGLFAWGQEGTLISNYLTSSTTFQQISVGTYGINGGATKADGLPDGVAPEDVKMLFGTFNALALTTCSGEVWVLGLFNHLYGDDATNSLTNHQLWHRVHTNATTTLDDVVAVRGNGWRTLMALTATGEVYTWGSGTRLGNGTAAATREFATQMTLPAGVTPKMIGVTGSNNVVPATYYILGTNGNVYALGENGSRELGNFSTTDSNVWVQVQQSATAGDYLTDVAWISPNEHDHRSYGNSNDEMVGSINVLTTDGRLWAWGVNDGQMLGGSGTSIDPTEMPGSIPSTDPYEIGKLNWTDKVIAVETGGHTSMIVKDNSKKYGYVGHRVNGSMGDGTSTDVYETQYNFADTPVIDLCGAPTEEEFCTQPGSTDAPTEFTKTGVSDRQDAVGTWPGNVPNGFIAIQSADKGFVITRLTTAQINALDAVEGMLVYDTDEECVKLYNGTVWKCLERSCNE